MTKDILFAIATGLAFTAWTFIFWRYLSSYKRKRKADQ